MKAILHYIYTIESGTLTEAICHIASKLLHGMGPHPTLCRIMTSPVRALSLDRSHQAEPFYHTEE